MVTAKKAPVASPASKSIAPAAQRTKAATAPVRAKPAPAAPVAVAALTVKAKVAKTKKPKLVRHSFTIPKPAYEVLTALKQRSATLGHPTRKSELLRAGIKALAAMQDAALSSALAAVPAITTGRPAGT